MCETSIQIYIDEPPRGSLGIAYTIFGSIRLVRLEPGLHIAYVLSKGRIRSLGTELYQKRSVRVCSWLLYQAPQTPHQAMRNY